MVEESFLNGLPKLSVQTAEEMSKELKVEENQEALQGMASIRALMVSLENSTRPSGL